MLRIVCSSPATDLRRMKTSHHEEVYYMYLVAVASNQTILSVLR